MSTGLYVHITKAAGTIVSAPLYNNAHFNQWLNDIPISCGAHSDDLTMFQATQDPAPLGVPNQVIDVGSELEQYRFALADIKTQLNDGVPPSEWYVPVTMTQQSVAAKGARVSRSTNQSIADNASTAITFTTVQYDTGIILPTFDPFWSALTPTRFTAPLAGIYEIVGFAEWASGASGPVSLAIRLNGTKILASTRWSANGTFTPKQHVATQYRLAANDYIELIAFQNTTGALNITLADFAIALLGLLDVTPAPTLWTLAVSESGTGSGTVTSSPGSINSPGVDSEDFADTTVVQLTATPTGSDTFVQWSGDVPIGHETDNPLTVTMDQDRTIDAEFSVSASPFAWPAFVGDSIDSGGGTQAFAALGWNGGWMASSSDVTMRVLKTTTITSWTAQMAAALAGTSITFELMVNGIADATMPIVVNNGEDGKRSVDGLLVLNPGDTISIRGTAVGGAETEIVNGFVFAYTSETPFFAVHKITSSSPHKIAFGGSSGAGQAVPNFSSLSGFETSLNPMTVDQIFDFLSIQLSASTSGTLQPQLGAVDTGPSVALVADDNVAGAIALTVPRTATVSDLPTFVATSLSGVILRAMATYALDTPFEGWCVIPSGMSFSQTLGTNAPNATNVYGMGSNLGKIDTSEAQVQLRWPNLPGTFQHMVSVAIMPAIPGSTTVEFGVRINGSATPFTTSTASAAPFVLSDDAANPHVDADDLVNFYGTVSPQTGTRATKTLFGVGFLAD